MVVIKRKIYILDGYHTNVEVYDVDQGILMEHFHFLNDIYRSVEHCNKHANYEIGSRCSCTGADLIKKYHVK